MARRNRDLAGLAALGALGLYMGRDGKKDKRGVGEDRKESVESETRLQTPARDEDDRDIGMISGASPSGLYRNTESGDLFSMNRPEEPVLKQRPVVATPGGKVAPATANRSMAAKANQEPYKNPQRGPSFEEISAYNRSRQTAGASTKPREGVAQASTRSMARDTRPDLSTPEGRKKAEQEQAIERVTPEEMLVGGPGLKALHAAAKRLAAPRLAEYSPTLLSGPTARLTGPSRAELTAAERAARDAARRAETARENAARYNTEGPLGGEGFIMRKKGGMVKAKKMASGGMTSKPSSASSRADGIASRGKTKCKMY